MIHQDDKGNTIQGVVPRIGVLWEHSRVPALKYEVPEDLFYLNVVDDFEDEEEEEDEDIEEDDVVEVNE
ncbi:MAG: hypothetical protein IT410_01260 [Candidatus Doudnabacteria bacterium]|nr:hypothetical protein [Candidatus Doudnabacteria bacterium]